MNRLRLVVLTLLVAVLTVAGLVSAQSSNATAAPGANINHPYSDPVWFPLRDQTVRLDCAGSSTNNNSSSHCSKDHVGYYAINFVVPKYETLPTPGNNGVLAAPHPNVYSAGAGIVSKVVTGQTCDHGSATLAGNVVYVQHGGGIVAVYQHLHSVSVTVGEYVTPKTVLGTVGATGAPCISGAEGPGYLDFQVRDWGGSAALTKDTPTLLACSAGKAVIWPKAIPLADYQFDVPSTAAQVWTQVPYGAGIYIPTGSAARPNADFSCVPSSISTTPSEISTAHMVTNSSSSHTLKWSPVSGANAYTVEFQVKKGSSYTVPCSPFATKGCTYGFYLFSATSTPHFTISGSGSYRARIYAHNSVGYSKVTGWYDA